MIPENTFANPHTLRSSEKQNPEQQISFKYFDAFAQYLLENKLEEFVRTQLLFSRELNLPILKFFENFSDEELISMGIENTELLLSYCANNRPDEYIHSLIEKWTTNQVTFVSPDLVLADDIVLAGLMRRKLFRHFITSYTDDVDLTLKVLDEADLFTSKMDSSCLNVLIDLHEGLFIQAQSLSHIGNWQWDIKTKKLIWSDEIYRIYELEPGSSIESEKIRQFNHPEDAALVNKYMESSMQTLKPHDFFYRIILKDGRQKTLHARGEVKVNEKGKPVEMFGTLQDVTEQKQAEKEIEESKKFIEKITDVSPCIITAYNIKSGQYLFLNKGIQRLLGYDTEEFYKKGREFFYALLHKDDIERVKEENAAAIDRANSRKESSNEAITEIKYRLKHKDGAFRWLQTFTTVFNKDKNQKVEDILNVSIDITESYLLTTELEAKKLELKIKELQHQRMISEVEDYAILLMDKEGFIQNWNKGAEKIKGYSANEIIGKNFRLFYRKEDQDRKLPEFLISEAAKHGKATHEGWRVRKDGSTFWGSIVITALHDDDNNLIGFTKVTRNLTEKKLADDKLKEYARRTEKHNEELQRMNKDLDSFTYMASHDLQEPLRKIRTFCNIILSKNDQALPPEVAPYFDRIITSVSRMQILIDSLLNYSRATTSEIELKPVPLSSVIEEVKKDLTETINENHASITYGKLPEIKMERLQFQQLFSNLIENAIKYKRENVAPEITINADKFVRPDEDGNQPEFYRIRVKDNGIGFEQKYAENVFKLFQRLHGRTEYSGTGIGLAICKKIVENHKGTIRAESEPGKGSSFIIELPINI